MIRSSTYLSTIAALFVTLSTISNCMVALAEEIAAETATPDSIRLFIRQNCLDCHNDATTEGGLDLSAQSFDLRDTSVFARWVQVHDRVQNGEMPPDDALEQADAQPFLDALAAPLAAADRNRTARSGRATVRRLNRYEYENSLRELFHAPWLMVADELPADGTKHLFSKSSEALDVSHVQMEKYLEVGKQAIKLATNAAAHPPETHRYYARRDKGMAYVNKTVRANVPVIGWKVDAAVMTKEAPVTAWDNPELQKREAVATFYGPHPAYTRVDFLKMNPPIDGRYRLRIKSYSIAAGNNGFSGYGLDSEKKGQERERWYRPNRLDIRRSKRDEPITLYALRDSGDTRLLASFDAGPEPNIAECEVTLRAGDRLRPDASRLPRLRPGFSGNPLVRNDEIPGWAIQWLEVEGPVTRQWPPESYQAVFGDMAFEVKEKRVRVISERQEEDARRLLTKLATRAFRGRELPAGAIDTYMTIFDQARKMGYDFTDAMIAASSAVITSPAFLYLQTDAGEPENASLAARLSYFLWNGPPDDELLDGSDLTTDAALRRQTERMLADTRSERFIEHFLDHWLELRDVNNTVPDAELYPEYYLDGGLTESAVLETRRFFRTLIDENLPARNLIDSEFTFVNERLARHYGSPIEAASSEVVDLVKDRLRSGSLTTTSTTPTRGIGVRQSIELQRISLPTDSPYGGLLTQASVLKVTANGTTTSPVLRGVWVVERLLGIDIDDPPSGVEAIEPDTRGATTIREQLAQHKEVESCAACHKKFDPVGFALENFDVMGGWQDNYRALGDIGEPVKGYGFNGHAFTYRLAKPVESHGELARGAKFDNIHELKVLLLKDERAIARNLVNRFIVYATGAPVSFADRIVVEQILDDAKPSQYGVRDLLHGVVRSKLFRNK